MSGVRAAKTLSAEAHAIDPARDAAEVQAMQDVLYDILANGMDPDRGEVPTQEVERFLFEHARSPKPVEEFRAFFAAHGLTLGSRPAPPPPALVLPPIERPEDRGMPARLPVELSVMADASAGFAPDDEVTATRLRKPVRFGLWAAVAGVFALLGGGGYYGYVTIRALQAELAQTAEHNRENQRALASLRDHAADLESSVAATGEIVERMDQKSDLLLESIAAAQDQAKAKSQRKRAPSARYAVPVSAGSAP